MFERIVIGHNGPGSEGARQAARDAAAKFLAELPRSDVVIIVNTHSSEDGTLLSDRLTRSQCPHPGPVFLMHSEVSCIASCTAIALMLSISVFGSLSWFFLDRCFLLPHRCCCQTDDCQRSLWCRGFG
jgi:hypothetical protein